MALKRYASKQIDSLKKEDSKGNIYWVEFIGNYAGVDRNQDAIFSTLMV
jgi:hypothetical protein